MIHRVPLLVYFKTFIFGQSTLLIFKKVMDCNFSGGLGGMMSKKNRNFQFVLKKSEHFDFRESQNTITPYFASKKLKILLKIQAAI